MDDDSDNRVLPCAATLLWNDFDNLICVPEEALSSPLGLLRAFDRALAEAEIVMALVAEGRMGRLRLEAEEGIPLTPEDEASRLMAVWVVAGGGGAGMPDMLCLRADIGAKRCAR